MKNKYLPVFSVIVPVFNAESTITCTLESVFRQSYGDFEVIIINDGSRDNSGKLIKRLIHNRENVRYLKQENAGVASARNKALGLARGKYFAFLDADDYWHEEKLKQFHLFIQSNPNTKVFYSDYQIITSNGQKLIKQYAPNQLSYNTLLWRNYIALSTAVVSRKDIEGVYFKNMGHEDYRFWLEVLSFQKSSGLALKVESETPLTVYRLSESSISRNKMRAIKWHWQILTDQNINIFSRFLYFTNYAVNNAFKSIKIKIAKKDLFDFNSKAR